MRDIGPSSHGTIGGMRLEAAEPGHLDEMLRLARERCRWMEPSELTDTFDGSLVALHHAVRAVDDHVAAGRPATAVDVDAVAALLGIDLRR